MRGARGQPGGSGQAGRSVRPGLGAARGGKHLRQQPASAAGAFLLEVLISRWLQVLRRFAPSYTGL